MKLMAEEISRESLREACFQSFAYFCRIMQDDGWFDPTHEFLCNWAQKQFLTQMQVVDRLGSCDGKLLIVMPRGSLKSTMITKYLPVWITLYLFYIRKDSSTRTLIAGNTFTNAKKKLKGIRALFDEQPLFQNLFPEILPKTGRKGNKWSDEGAEIRRTGSFDEATFECAGTNTKLTGRHYNILIEDDTTAPDVDEMKENMTLPSRETIEKAVGFHKAAFPLFVPKGLRLSIVVSTRWSMDDLVAYVDTHESYNCFNMPAKNKEGKNNFSCFYGDDTLNEIKKRIGPFMFNMLYLNEPQDPSTRIFSKENFKYVRKENVPQLGFKTIAVDPAIAAEDESCDSSITVMQHVQLGPRRSEYWHRDVNGKFLPFQLAKKILQVAREEDTKEVPVKCLILEDNAWQMALKYILLNLMEEEASRGLRKFSITTFTSGRTSGKHLRIRSMQPSFMEGRITFVIGSLSDQTESQLIQYPNGAFVDTIDSWSMHQKFFGYDKYESKLEEDSLQENSFEAACESIKKRNKKGQAGLAEELPLEAEFTGLSEW